MPSFFDSGPLPVPLGAQRTSHEEKSEFHARHEDCRSLLKHRQNCFGEGLGNC